MPSAIFLRAVNVGGHKSFSVAALAKKLGLVNIGAAGTFVARAGTAASARKSIAAALPFETDIMVVSGADVRALLDAAPFAGVAGKPFVSVLAKAPGAAKLPVEDKGIRLFRAEKAWALSVVLPSAKPGANVNALVEKTLGVAATTRGWPTMAKVGRALDEA